MGVDIDILAKFVFDLVVLAVKFHLFEDVFIIELAPKSVCYFYFTDSIIFFRNLINKL